MPSNDDARLSDRRCQVEPEATTGASIEYPALPQRLSGNSVTPADPRYEAVRSTFTKVGSPELVILAEDVEDVCEAVKFAARQEVAVSVRSGGHGPSGCATNEGGIIIDVSRMDSIDILDTQTRLFRAGPGATWGPVAAELARFGWAMTSGNSGDVGVAGLATSGGIGWLVRMHGLTLDHIVAAELVLADGSHVRADSTTCPDLFWAVRGAAASIGIVTALEFQALKLERVVSSTIELQVANTAAFLRSWSACMASAPRQLTSHIYVLAGPDPESSLVSVMSVWADDDIVAAEAAIEPILRFGEVTESSTELVQYADLVPTLNELHYGQLAIAMRNSYLGEMRPSTATALSDLLRSSTIQQLEIRSVGGAVSDVDPAATAYAHREAQLFVAAWGNPNVDAELDATWDAVACRMSGTYASYTCDARPHIVRQAYPGDTYHRLVQIKRRYDPRNVFSQGITVAPES